VDQPAALRGGENGDGVCQAVGDQIGALQRIDRDVDLGLAGPLLADRLADPQHRRLVALALTDDDRAADLDVFQRAAHRLGRRAIRFVPIATTHEARRSDGRLLGHTNHLERQERLHGRAGHRR
jgi:hypothetical protein